MSQTENKLKHVAIIMDGNGRWAQQRRLPRIAGHRTGATAVRKAIEFSLDKKLEVLTLFALSVENFNLRPLNEVRLLLRLFSESLRDNIKELKEKNIRLRIVGDRTHFDKRLTDEIEFSENLTKDNSGLQLIIAINYSGRWDIVQAVRNLAEQAMARKLRIEDITPAVFQHHLCLPDLPDPDLLIRTSGEQRISNFMLWQFAYTEIYFSNTYWPDFDAETFQQAINFYFSTQRRFGQTAEQVESQYA